MKISILKYLLTSFLLAAVALAAPAASIRLSVEMPRGKRSISEGDIFWISYTVSDARGSVPRPSSAGGCSVLYFEQTGSSSSYQSVNGHVSQSHSVIYTLTLKARKQGRYTFGPVSAGGVTSNTVSYTIGPPGQDARTEPDHARQQAQTQASGGPKFIGKGDGKLFLRASVSKTTAYEQEALVYTVKLYTSYDGIRFVGAASAPKFDGFTVEESKDVSQQLRFETYNGRSYATAIIARYIIFPQMKGRLKVIGNTYTVSVDEREYYADPFWGNMSVSKPIQLNVTPNDLAIDVRPLPEPRPDGFSGGVGDFKISASIKPGAIKTNEPFSVVYTISGRGNIKYIKLPELNGIYPREFETFSPNVDTKANVGSDNVSGTVAYDYSVVPLKEGRFTLPPVKLIYFNPRTGRYETSTSRSFDVNVGRGSARRTDSSVNRLDRSFAPIDSGLAKEHPLTADSWLYWMWYIIPALLLISAAVGYRSYVKANADQIKVRRRKASSLAARRLKKARTALNRGAIDSFYEELLTALWAWLSDRLSIPVSDLNRDSAARMLQDNGADPADIAILIDLIDKCEYAHYAPKSDMDDPEADYRSAAAVIPRLAEQLNKKAAK